MDTLEKRVEAAQRARMRFIHFGDLHVWRWAMDWSDPLYLKRYLAYANMGLKRRKKFPPELGQQVMAHLANMEADVVVSSGDFSTTGRVDEFEEAARLLAPVHEKWGERFFAIPGNHDRYTPKTVRDRRYEKAFPYGVLDGVRSLELGNGIVIVACDVCVPCHIRSNGVFDKARAEALSAELAKHAGKTVILTTHYPYANVPEHPESWEHCLIGEEHLAEVVAEHKPTVYLHGHKHVRWALRSRRTPDTLCLNCGSAGMTSSSFEKQAGFISFELEPGGEAQTLRSHTLDATTGELVHKDLEIRDVA